MTSARRTLTSVITVAVPVSDQDAAQALFGRLGFETTFDAFLQEGFRWIDLALPGGGASISLVAAGPDLPCGIDTGIRFATADARAAHAEMQALGFDVGELLDWESAPLMFSCTDPDGNRFYVTQDS